MRSLVNTLISWGPLGVLLLAAVDSSGIPLPAGVDVLLIVLATADPGGAFLSAALAILGSLAGCLFLFYAARKGGQRFLDARTATGRAARFRRWYLRYGLLTIFIPALVPILPLPLKVFVLCAGALGVRPATFALVVLLARIPRYFGLAYLGAQLGEHSLGYLHDHRWHLAAIAAGLFLSLALLIRLSGRPASER